MESSEASIQVKAETSGARHTEGNDSSAQALSLEFVTSQSTAAGMKQDVGKAAIEDKTTDQKSIQPLPPWKPDPICNPPFDPFCKPDNNPFPWENKPSEPPQKTHPTKHKHK